MTKHELSEQAGISISFLSDLTNGKGNPSLRIMEAIADALAVPLPFLLESNDLDALALEQLTGGKQLDNLPDGYERVYAVLPSHQAFMVRRWTEAARKKLAPD